VAVFHGLFAIPQTDGLVDYPRRQSISGTSMAARKLGKRQGLASVILVVFGIGLIVVPTWLLMSSFADSVQRFVGAVQQNTLHKAAPPESVKNLPLVSNKIHAGWSKAQTDLPGVVRTMQPKIGDLARYGHRWNPRNVCGRDGVGARI
jgi:hypothetical protein